MDLFIDICAAIGLGAACALSPLLALAALVLLVVLEAGLNLAGTSADFLDDPAFAVIAGLLVAVILFSYAGWLREWLSPRSGGRSRVAYSIAAAICGALCALIAGLDENRPEILFGLIGAGSAVIVAFGLGGLLTRATDRLRGGDQAKRESNDEADEKTTVRVLWAVTDIGAVAVVVAAVFIPPVAALLLPLSLWLILAERKRRDAKFEGLRVLR